MGDAKPILSLTAADFRWDFSRGTGKGGQKRNKTSSKARCVHVPSGAEGVSDETRSQHQNRQAAFLKCVACAAFKAWIRIEVARISGATAELERKVDAALRQVTVEVHDEAGRWVPAPAELDQGVTRG